MNTEKSKIPFRRKNFLPKKNLQWRLIGKITILVFLSIMVSIGVTSLLYYDLSNVEFKGEVPFYYITEDVPEEAQQQPTAFDILLPGLLVSGSIMALLTVIIGVLASHKIAGAIYALQRDVNKINHGDYSVIVQLRKKDELQDLAADINNMVRNLKSQLEQLRLKLANIKINIAKIPSSSEKEALLKELIAAENILNYFNLG